MGSLAKDDSAISHFRFGRSAPAQGYTLCLVLGGIGEGLGECLDCAGHTYVSGEGYT